MAWSFVRVFSGMGMMTLFLFVVACSRAPKGVIPEKKMQRILTDMHMVDALLHVDPSKYQTDEDKKALYLSVFEKHRVSEAIYDSSLVWYGKHLDVYMQVYKMALADVKKRIELIGDIEQVKPLIGNEDRVDIWSIGRYYEFFPASLSNRLMFSFTAQDDFSSGSIFVLGLSVMGLVPDIQSPVEVHLRADQNDTTVVIQNNISHDGYYELQLRTNPIQKIKRVYGYVRFNEGTASYHKVYLNDFRMMKYRYGSEIEGENN